MQHVAESLAPGSLDRESKLPAECRQVSARISPSFSPVWLGVSRFVLSLCPSIAYSHSPKVGSGFISYLHYYYYYYSVWFPLNSCDFGWVLFGFLVLQQIRFRLTPTDRRRAYTSLKFLKCQAEAGQLEALWRKSYKCFSYF